MAKYDKIYERLDTIEFLIAESEARRKTDGWWTGVALLLIGIQVYFPNWWEYFFQTKSY